jgi:hypothetical protein
MTTRKMKTINDFWRTIARHPGTLARIRRDLKEVVVSSRLHPLTRDMTAIAVSATSGCCGNAHRGSAGMQGMANVMSGESMGMVGTLYTTNKLVQGWYKVEGRASVSMAIAFQIKFLDCLIGRPLLATY